MKLLFLHWRERLQTSIWFIPALFCIGCSLLALGLLWVDRDLARLLPWDSLRSISLASARDVLGVIAGAVLSVGGVVFSVTMVALTLTSGQYGPKIIRQFLSDNDSKVSLGLFLGTGLYCMVAIAGFREGDNPGVTVLAGMLLTVLALAGFIRFIHGTATELQADQIIERVARELQRLLQQLHGEEQFRGRAKGTLGWRRAARGEHPWEVGADTTGYVQAVAYSALTEWCVEYNCLCLLRVQAGDFLLHGNCFATLYGPRPDPDSEALAALRRCVSTGPIRTPMQDPEYPVTQLHQLAARALSPGINDPGTAITCIDWYTMAIAEIANCRLPGNVFLDENEQPRVLARLEDFTSILNGFYTPVRQLASGNIQVLESLYDSLISLARITAIQERLDQLAAHGRAIQTTLRAQKFLHEDIRGLMQRHEKLCALTRRPLK